MNETAVAIYAAQPPPVVEEIKAHLARQKAVTPSAEEGEEESPDVAYAKEFAS